MEETYFGSRKVSESGSAENSDQMWVIFDDGSREIMHKAEWESAKGTEPSNEDFEFDKKRLTPASQELLGLIKKRNLRLEDLGFLFRMAIDSIQLAVNQAKEAAFGQPAWTVRVDDIQKVLDENPGKKRTEVIRDVQGTVIRY